MNIVKTRGAISWFVLVCGLAVSACSGSASDDGSLENMTVAREDMPHEIAVLIDAGNAAFSAGDYETARGHYLGAATRDSTIAAAWYGLAMSERALGNDAVADSVLRRLGALGATANPHHGAADTLSESPHGLPHGSPHGLPPEETQGSDSDES